MARIAAFITDCLLRPVCCQLIKVVDCLAAADIAGRQLTAELFINHGDKGHQRERVPADIFQPLRPVEAGDRILENRLELVNKLGVVHAIILSGRAMPKQ